MNQKYRVCPIIIIYNLLKLLILLKLFRDISDFYMLYYIIMYSIRTRVYNNNNMMLAGNSA